jgi:hypothetical protein
MRAPHGSNGKSHAPTAILERRNGTALELPARKPQLAAPRLAPFATVEARAADEPMWPLNPVAWFHPELTPRSLPSSGLLIDRQHRIPAPDFAPLGITPVAPLPPAGEGDEPLLAKVERQLPHSDLRPLGWDPRAHAIQPQQEGKP